jgi:ubiquinone/menaquinone biosynthesis C-methylase UbiE
VDYNEHKKYFEEAYRTGTDIWTHLPMKARGGLLTDVLSPGALVLDVGSGRGLFSKQLAESGFRVIGIDFEKNIVEKTNEEVIKWGLTGKLKFVEASALDIPFTDNSFDGVCDFGLMDNLYPEDWEKYASEISRVLKHGGFYLNMSFSRETQHFFEFYPKGSETGEFQKYGVHYHFFKRDEMKKIFDHQLNPIKQDIEFTEKPNEIALLETLFQKPK